MRTPGRRGWRAVAGYRVLVLLATVHRSAISLDVTLVDVADHNTKLSLKHAKHHQKVGTCAATHLVWVLCLFDL